MDETRKKKLVNLLEMKENPIAKTLIEIERVDSAIQEIQNDSQKIVEAINELDQTKASKRELEIAIEGVQTIKGDRGFKGEKGADGKDGKDGLNGKDGKDGVDGIDGKDGKDGVDGIDGKDGKDGSPDTPDQVIEKIHKSKKLIKKEKIEGLEDIERKADFALNRPLIQGVGGGSSGIREIRAGSGISVSNVNEIVTVSAPGSTTDEKVAYKSGSTPGYLKDVTVAGTGITLEEGTGGDAGKLKITNSLDLSGYVPYTGATADLNLGTHSITASNFTGSSSGSNTGDQDLSNLVEEAPSDDKQYARKNAGWVEVEAGSTGDGIGFDIDGFGIVPSTTVIGSYVAKKSGTITGWKIIESNGVSSSIVLTVKKNGTEISGTEKPTLSNASSAEDTELTTWTTSIAKGDIISISIDSVSVGTKFFLQIYYS